MSNADTVGIRDDRRDRHASTGSAPAFGVHLTVDGYGGSQHLLADADHVLAIFVTVDHCSTECARIWR